MAAGTDFLIRESFETYRSHSRDHLTSHQLGDFRRCPMLYRRKKLGLIPDEDRPAFLVGRAAHALALEGRDKYQAEYTVGGPINLRTGEPYGAGTKAFTEWAAATGKQVLTADQAALVESMAAAVRGHEIALVFLSRGVAEGVARVTYRGALCQSRVDWLSPDTGGGIVDLKTCDDLTWFEADARRYGYAHQMAFYRAVLHRACGVEFPVHIVAVEKKEPFRCGVWRLSDDALAVARHENESAIERLLECEKSGDFPSGYEEPRVFDSV